MEMDCLISRKFNHRFMTAILLLGQQSQAPLPQLQSRALPGGRSQCAIPLRVAAMFGVARDRRTSPTQSEADETVLSHWHRAAHRAIVRPPARRSQMDQREFATFAVQWIVCDVWGES